MYIRVGNGDPKHAPRIVSNPGTSMTCLTLNFSPAAAALSRLFTFWHDATIAKGIATGKNRSICAKPTLSRSNAKRGKPESCFQ